ncbi:N-acetyl-gamma-glutamyl-phosphate reductase [Lederbergia wuyishanensis]|uniref:N-acetyl-gamma-glutamyl-phosphate reductase n=1 Tax=Lederbergia wuyishanensis TaxID=1347903 RepID=A0ABU0D027_9BACI|nr:N-acetyl-gamma-glutamyl-phosphate reductase [Lederbergia wuyishanensis]MCJ8006397.1 N-acetyl-gamma-glutamyl-phosphate reductase [Lederbergia wuyishanensis]MDQ0341767.1 N-acetyl-gamma-glutamyl-phosphate reductase [Lederbergia wuyishanensis]
MRVGIVGATGYGGAELLRILHTHPYFEITALYTSSQQGRNIHEHYPHLTGIIPLTLEEINPIKMAKDTDVVFLAVPTGVASQLAPELLSAGCMVIDLTGDFRLKNTEDYEFWYKREAAPKEWIQKAVYSIPELNNASIKGSQFISNPGCYPTATLLGLAPLAKAKMLKEGSVIIDAKSGVSGAGQTVSLGNIYSELNENFKIYKVNQHQHIPEIEQMLKELGYVSPVTFQTHLVPMTRGIMTTIYGSVEEKITEDELWKLYYEFYIDKPFVRVREMGVFPATKEVAASNYCDIGISFDERTGRATIVSVIDNLMKGAAGQAVQNANLLFGFEETAGLHFSPIYP